MFDLGIIDVYQNRDSIVVWEQLLDSAGAVIDYTGATVSGAIKADPDDAAIIVALTLDNTLATGIIKAYLAEANYAAVRTALGEKQGYFDIWLTESGGLKIQYYHGRIAAKSTVTA